MSSPERLMLPEEVAGIYHVDPSTVARWARKGRIAAIRTPGGQWRVYASDVEAQIARPATDPHGVHSAPSMESA
ncbi:helix-turn-helix domain-containing protein [Nonomuraea wenchangensis]|uniref:helix-turn-helix domain-containing protein n=1 Tax=Nonomuraea wenchangensis TaxID=568860 RepID=UPI003326E67F